MHKKGSSQDAAVHSDQGQKDTQGIVKAWREPLNNHLEQLHNGCHYRDEDDEAQKAIDELNGATVEGRTIVVNKSEPKPEGERKSYNNNRSGGGYSGGGNSRGGGDRGRY